MIDQMVDSAIEGVFGNSSKSEKEDPIESDTVRQNNDEPLKYYRSERKLKAARQDRFLNEIISNTKD